MPIAQTRPAAQGSSITIQGADEVEAVPTAQQGGVAAGAASHIERSRPRRSGSSAHVLLHRGQ